MNKEEIELSKKLAALPMPYFEWRDGTLSRGGGRIGTAFDRENDEPTDTPQTVTWVVDDWVSDLCDVDEDAYPDLRDDATAGVLLGLLSEPSWLNSVVRPREAFFVSVETPTHKGIYSDEYLGVAVAKALIALSAVEA